MFVAIPVMSTTTTMSSAIADHLEPQWKFCTRSDLLGIAEETLEKRVGGNGVATLRTIRA
jgi:hypothetical protein